MENGKKSLGEDKFSLRSMKKKISNVLLFIYFSHPPLIASSLKFTFHSFKFPFSVALCKVYETKCEERKEKKLWLKKLCEIKCQAESW